MMPRVEPTQSSEILGKTILSQHRASNPLSSAWVSANAGSGKTYVLAQRVVRLLLAGVAPSKILCLTFTKAAAAEMSNRVFKQLSRWSTLDDATLSDELKSAGEPDPSPVKLHRARLLFTRAMESPGGLKIQTIHAFCEALLHQFTLEANTSGHFEVMGDYDKISLLENARQTTFAATLTRTDLGNALASAMRYAKDTAIEEGLDAIIGMRQKFTDWLRSNNDSPADAIASIGKTIGVDANEPETELATRLLARLPISDVKLKELGLAAGHMPQAECKRIAKTIQAITYSFDPIQLLNRRISLYQTKDGDFRKRVGVIALFDAAPGSQELFEAEMEAIKPLAEEYTAWKMLQGSRGLFELADSVLNHYASAKRARGLLDFDDLVNRAANLLARSDVRQWVQFKLDAGIDHVLIDEAQDTSPTQWEIINAISEEFFAGQSVTQNAKTIFAVGDQKQSIYSFQGAVPEMFSRQKQKTGTRAGSADIAFEDVRLDISFRSTRDVLSAVDKVFANPENARGLQADDVPIDHEPNRQSDPGEVIIWPMMEMPAKEKQVHWTTPVDQVSEDHPTVQLAKRIAETVRDWIKNDVELPGKGRQITCGDILILVRKRDQFASAITRELKYAGLSVAGADRLSLTSHIAIEDLLSLGSWALFPEDDLSLAEVLKSPLFGFDDDDLMELCINREDANLWQSLSSVAVVEKPTIYSTAHSDLTHLLKTAHTLPPYEFYNDILSTGSGRKKFKARLGDEVDDVLDAFLLEALNHSVNGGSGLQEFISALETASPEIKREMDLERDEIRVMTVHSAKGLEAPIVFLVDSGGPAFSSNHRPKIITVNNDTPYPGLLWQPTKKEGTGFTDQIYQRVTQKAEEEYRRLLYVGMTRAEDKLVMCGYANSKTKNHLTWHRMVTESLSENCMDIGNQGDLRWIADHPLRKTRAAPDPDDAEIPAISDLPAWISKPVTNEVRHLPPLAPSRAAANLEAGYREQDKPVYANPLSDSFALQRGNAIHYLLQVLPQTTTGLRRSAAMRYLLNTHGDWPDDQHQEVVTAVMSILDNPQFANLFAPGSKAELGITGILDPDGLNTRISGQIDRLVVTDENTLIVDYKSDRNVPTSPENISGQYLVQLAIYKQLVEDIYPHKPVTCAILWTSGPDIMEIPAKLLQEQLAAWLRCSG